MRVVYLTPGTGNFHCGSCLRDHALAKSLRAKGHEVLIIPLYLPLVLDDDGSEQEKDGPLFLGGINMYLQQKSAFFRWTPRWIDRFLDRRSLLLKLVEKAGMTQARDLGELTLSTLMGEDGKQRKEVERLVEWLAGEQRPDVIVFSNGLLTGLAGAIKKALGVPILCTLQGEDSFIETLPDPYREQSWELLRQHSKHVDLYIAVSDFHGGVMKKHLHLKDEHIVTVHNGIDFAPFRADPEKRCDPPVIGYLARMCMGKGMHTLVDAFIDLRKRETVKAKLHLAGAKTSADDAYVEQQRRKLEAAGLMKDVKITPNVSHAEKVEFLQSISVFSVPACYGESFGLYVIEALACQVPVVQPDHGAFPEILAKTGGGILCDPEDPASLADSLEVMLTLEERRRKLGVEGWQKARQYFTADRMADEMVQHFEAVIPKNVEAKA